ncbi:MAG: MBOAT family protein [Ruminococcus sp.]|nr:MBOAT family protein [Ruminococcus sp.]
MAFSNLFFLYLFFIVFFIFYYATKNRYRNAMLVFFSIIFYVWGETEFIWLLLISALMNFAFGKVLSSRTYENQETKGLLITSILCNIGILVLFKYTGFFVENINAIFSTSIPVPKISSHLPLGISFYTFRAISYLVDCAWGKVQAEKKFSNFLLYISMFPIITQGPIVRYETIAPDLDNRKITAPDISEGLTRIIIGLGKKVIIADNLASVVDQFLANGNINSQTTLGAWFGVILYSMQIYFDFSGYSDMAIGLGRMLGFKFLENFRYPFLCKDVTEFWQRWHISLGTFFRDYVLYMPIFGKRRKFGGLFLVWFCTGLWHGASWNYILWGLYYGFFVLIEMLVGKKNMKKIPLFIRHIYNKVVIIIGFGIFYFEDLGELSTCLKCMFGLGENGFIDPLLKSSFIANIYLIIVALICCFPILEIPKRIMKKSPQANLVISVSGTILAIAVLIISSILLVDATNRPFLYLRF